MNLVGKILTVLILIMSLAFMGFAVAVYATHRNWKEVVLLPEDQVRPGKNLGLTYVVKKLGDRNQKLKDQKIQLEGDVEAERKAKDQAVAKLESQYELIKGQHAQLGQKHEQLVKDQREAVAAMKATQTTLVSLRDEVLKLRTSVAEAQKDRDGHFKEVVRLTDELHQAINERQRLNARQTSLDADLSKAKQVLRHFGHDKDMSLDSFPPQVDGIVLAVPQPSLVEISIGSDDGLKEGHSLEVYRTAGGSSTYVGRIHVVKTSYDKAACKVDPNYRKSNVQRGDRVTSKIR